MTTSTYDLIVRGGTVVDGTGMPRRRADIGVRDGRIATIEPEISGRASKVIDASDRIVAPGFIDVHTHYDVQAFWDPAITPSAVHGFTTVIGGNCGFSVAPLEPTMAPYLMRMLARVEGMPLATLERRADWDWGSMADFLGRLEGTVGLNVGFLVGHSAVRTSVMREAACEREATGDEVAAMAAVVAESLRAGALGFSSSWAETHSDDRGEPVPSRHASLDELVTLAATCREFAGTSLEFVPQGLGPFTDRSVDAMTAMSSAAQRPVNWNVLTVSADNAEEVAGKLAAADTAAQAGGRITALTIPMPIVAHYSFHHGFQIDSLPDWGPTMALPVDARADALRDHELRRRLDAAAQASSLGPHVADWANRRIGATFAPQNERFRGRIVGEIAAERGVSALDALLDIAIDDGLLTTFTRVRPPDTTADWAARVEVWRDRRALVGASDAGAHLDFFGAFNYSTVLLAEAVRNHQVITLEEAVHLLTKAPADFYGLVDRGVLTVGSAADLVVFDEATVASETMRPVADLEGGSSRLLADSAGIEHVVVNGVTVVEGGVTTAARPGRVLRRGTDTRTPSMAA